MSETVFNNIDPATMERIKQLRLIDDELMTVVFGGDKKATELLIRILLNRNDLKVTKSMTQEQKHNLFGRSVTLDIVAEDIFMNEYNIEIQRADKGDIEKRIRYHQAMIDSHTLKKQEEFGKLPNLYIIFILEHDLYGKDVPIYYVRKILNVNDEEGNPLLFNDGCNIMYVNGEYKGEDALGKLMHDFSTPNADEMYYKELAEKVRFYKQDETGVQMASKIVEEYGDERAAQALQQGIQQGIQQGALQQAIDSAKNMLRIGLGTHEQIAQAQNLPLKKVQELAEEVAFEKNL
ncbi:MAG: Rpn family recombination-promoting nuclease/putative transposase [Treponema sp.]|nr:Rpn family recombination-promoting nuclease/putative transposase [Treponema sp.]